MPKSPTPASASVESLSFEAALAELEKLVAGMESGQLSLEQSLAAHKRGEGLLQRELSRFHPSDEFFQLGQGGFEAEGLAARGGWLG